MNTAARLFSAMQLIGCKKVIWFSELSDSNLSHSWLDLILLTALIPSMSENWPTQECGSYGKDEDCQVTCNFEINSRIKQRSPLRKRRSIGSRSILLRIFLIGLKLFHFFQYYLSIFLIKPHNFFFPHFKYGLDPFRQRHSKRGTSLWKMRYINQLLH